MATELKKPAHITRPNMGRTLVGYHPLLDLSVWVMGTGREALSMRGTCVSSKNPREDLTNYKQAPLQGTVGIINVLFKIDVRPPGRY